MKKIKLFATFFLGLVLFGFLFLQSVLYYGKLRNTNAEESIKFYVKEITAYKKREGHYPSSIKDIANPDRMDKLFYLFPTSEIIYKPLDSEYIIYFIEFPLGPGQVYSSATGEWTYEEI